MAIDGLSDTACVRAHSDGRVNVHRRTSFHGIEDRVTFTSFPAVKPFPAERTLLGKVSRRDQPKLQKAEPFPWVCHTHFIRHFPTF